MADTEQLRQMVDNIVADKPEQAQVNFHEYMRDKVREQLGLSTADSNTTDEE